MANPSVTLKPKPSHNLILARVLVRLLPVGYRNALRMLLLDTSGAVALATALHEPLPEMPPSFIDHAHSVVDAVLQHDIARTRMNTGENAHSEVR